MFALGAVGTSAYWTDTATVTGTSINAGSMDLQVAASTAGPWNAVGTGANWTGATHVAVANLTPSESYAFNLGVRNFGDADFTYSATVTQGTSPAWGFSSGVITVQFFRGGGPSTDVTYPIQQDCGVGTSLGPAVAVTNGNSALFNAAEGLNKGANQSLCLRVAMTPAAGNANQGMSGQLRFDFTANQVTS